MADFVMKLGKRSEKIGDTVATGDGATVTFSTDDEYNTGDTKKNKSMGTVKNTAPSDGTVGVRDYVSGAGYDSIVDWDGENVTVGGIKITPQRIVNGTAYADRAAVEDALKRTEERNGILGTERIRDMYEKRYGRAVDDALAALLDREPYSYSPENDAVYRAYERQYRALAEDAYRRVLNDNNTSVYGASGAVLSEAIAAREKYMKKLTDMLPQLEENAYSRYSDESGRLVENLKLLSDIAGSYYDRLYSSDRDAREDLVNAGRAEHKEEQRWIENARADRAEKRADRAADRADLAESRAGVNDAYSNALKALEAEKNRAELSYYPAMLAEELAAARIKNRYAQDEVSHAYDIAYAKAKAAMNVKLGY